MQDALEFLKQRSQSQLQYLPENLAAPVYLLSSLAKKAEDKVQPNEIAAKIVSSYTRYLYSGCMPSGQSQAPQTTSPTWSIELLPSKHTENSTLLLGQKPSPTAKAKSFHKNNLAPSATALLRPCFSTLKDNYSPVLQHNLEQCQLLIIPTPNKIAWLTLELEQLQAELSVEHRSPASPAQTRRTQQNKTKLTQKKDAIQKEINKRWRAYAADIFACLDFIASKRLASATRKTEAQAPLQLYCSEPSLFHLYDYLSALQQPELSAQQANKKRQCRSEIESAKQNLGNHFPDLIFHSLQTLRIGHSTGNKRDFIKTTGVQEFSPENPSLSSFSWGHWQFCLVLEAQHHLGALQHCSKLSGYWAANTPAFIEFELGRKWYLSPQKAKSKHGAETEAQLKGYNAQDATEKSARNRWLWFSPLRKSVEQKLADIHFSSFSEAKLASWLALPLIQVPSVDTANGTASTAGKLNNISNTGDIFLGNFRCVTQSFVLRLRQNLQALRHKFFLIFQRAASLDGQTFAPHRTHAKYAVQGLFALAHQVYLGENTISAISRKSQSWEEAYLWKFHIPSLESSTLYYQTGLLKDSYRSPDLAQQCLAIWQQEKILWQNFLQAARHCALLANSRTNPNQKSFCLVIERELQHFLQYSEQWETKLSNKSKAWKLGIHNQEASQLPLFRLRDARYFWADFMAHSRKQPFPTMLLWALWRQLEPRLARKIQHYPKIKRFLRQHLPDFSLVMRQLGLQRQWQLRPVLRYAWSASPRSLSAESSNHAARTPATIEGPKHPLAGLKYWLRQSTDFVLDTWFLLRQRSKYGRYVQGAAAWRKLWPHAMRRRSPSPELGPENLANVKEGQLWEPYLALATVSNWAWPSLEQLLLEAEPLFDTITNSSAVEEIAPHAEQAEVARHSNRKLKAAFTRIVPHVWEPILRGEAASWPDIDLLSHLKQHFDKEALAFQRVAKLEQQLQDFQYRNIYEANFAKTVESFLTLSQTQATLEQTVADKQKVAKTVLLRYLLQSTLAFAKPVWLNLQKNLGYKLQAIYEGLLLLDRIAKFHINHFGRQTAKPLLQYTDQLLLAADARKLQKLKRHSQKTEQMRQKEQTAQQRREALQMVKQQQRLAKQQAKEEAKEQVLQLRQARELQWQQELAAKLRTRTERLREKALAKMQRHDLKMQAAVSHSGAQQQRQQRQQRQKRWQQWHDNWLDNWLDNWQNLLEPQRRFGKQWQAFYRRQRRAVWVATATAVGLGFVLLFLPKELYKDTYSLVYQGLTQDRQPNSEAAQAAENEELLQEKGTKSKGIDSADSADRAKSTAAIESNQANITNIAAAETAPRVQEAITQSPLAIEAEKNAEAAAKTDTGTPAEAPEIAKGKPTEPPETGELGTGNPQASPTSKPQSQDPPVKGPPSTGRKPLSKVNKNSAATPFAPAQEDTESAESTIPAQSSLQKKADREKSSATPTQEGGPVQKEVQQAELDKKNSAEERGMPQTTSAKASQATEGTSGDALEATPKVPAESNAQTGDQTGTQNEAVKQDIAKSSVASDDQAPQVQKAGLNNEPTSDSASDQSSNSNSESPALDDTAEESMPPSSDLANPAEDSATTEQEQTGATVTAPKPEDKADISPQEPEAPMDGKQEAPATETANPAPASVAAGEG